MATLTVKERLVEYFSEKEKMEIAEAKMKATKQFFTENLNAMLEVKGEEKKTKFDIDNPTKDAQVAWVSRKSKSVDFKLLEQENPGLLSALQKYIKTSETTYVEISLVKK